MSNTQDLTQKAKVLNIITTLMMAINLIAGVVCGLKFGMGVISIGIIVVFIVLHTIIRMQFLKTQNTQSAVNAPQAIRTLAVAITSIVVANVLFWLGFGISLIFSSIFGA